MTGSECAWLRFESIHMSVTTNPYAPPKARVEDVVQSSSDAEAIRREFLKHETSVRSIGTLYYLAGGLLCVGALFLAILPWLVTMFGLIGAGAGLVAAAGALALGMLWFILKENGNRPVATPPVPDERLEGEV